MDINQYNKIYPCPFSRGYGIPIEQAWSLLKVVFIYRFMVSSLFLILFNSPWGPSLLGTYQPQLYSFISQFYWLFCVSSGLFVFNRLISYTTQAQSVIFSDIFFITLLMHASGGIHSGIGILLAISIAFGGLLIGGRCALFFAALASLAILAEQIFIIEQFVPVKTSFSYAGMLGATFFTTAYLSYFLAKQTEQSEKIASQHQQTISNLEELNQYIIQYLQSGIIITNSRQQIKMCNESAKGIIGRVDLENSPMYLKDVSSELVFRFQHWLDNESDDYALIVLIDNREVYFRFVLINTHLETFYMIIVDDISLYNQKLQQSKLASLGRLTASIAHEIRNPLGAISHAGQLLSEASELDIENKRLVEIIQSHCLRVNKIIEDILQLSRRELSKKEKLNLNHWVENSLNLFVQDVGCNPDCFQIQEEETDLWVYMDSGHLKQIFDNLCSNAIKYGDLSVYRIRIVLTRLDGMPAIKIMDNGTKIDDETISHLFEPFFTTSSTGTGLGLYISKELAELNRAKLVYETTEDSKCCFILSLPNASSSLVEI